ncbi:hypothetical protein SLEP1_g11910 [Rubroshorea leprosula]|nr:hypothetical protein SLEP1_g11910 [Rubroshorea leprosula]
MANEKLFSTVFIFLNLIFILEIQSIEGRCLKFDSEKLSTYKRFLTKTAKVVESRSSLHATYVEASANDKLQPPPAARLATGAVVGASQAPPQRHATNFRPTEPGHGLAIKASVEAGDAKVSYPPPPPYIGHRWFSDETNPLTPPAPLRNPPIHN